MIRNLANVYIYTIIRKSLNKIYKHVNQIAHIDLGNIQVTDSKVSLDTPMSFLAKIPHNINSELVIRNMNCFAIITSHYCW